MCLVTAVVRDPAGNIYANAFVIASFVGQSAVPGAGPYVTGGVPQGQFQPIVPTETDSFGALSMSLPGNDTITPSPSQWKFTVVSNTTIPVAFGVLVTISGASQDISAALQAAAASLNPASAFGALTCTSLSDSGAASVGGTLAVTGTSIQRAVLADSVQQRAANIAFQLLDNLGVGHFFISNTSPYANTFISGNGAGTVFLGSAAKASVADTTGAISTDGGLQLYSTSHTLPMQVINNTGGITFISNSGKLVTIDTNGILFLFGATSGNTGLQASAIASGILTLPATTDTLVVLALAQTLTNKRVTPRQVAVADATSITPNSDTTDVCTQTNTQAGGTLTINAPTGTPTDGQKLLIRIKSTNSQTYSFNGAYHFGSTVTAPTTLAAGKTDYIGCSWNATNSAWDVLAVAQGY